MYRETIGLGRDGVWTTRFESMAQGTTASTKISNHTTRCERAPTHLATDVDCCECDSRG